MGRTSVMLLALVIILTIMLAALLYENSSLHKSIDQSTQIEAEFHEPIPNRFDHTTHRVNRNITVDEALQMLIRDAGGNIIIHGINHTNQTIRANNELGVDAVDAVDVVGSDDETDEVNGTVDLLERQRTNHNDDTQNVHNSQVVRDLKRKWNRLLQLNNMSEIPEHLRDHMTPETWKTNYIEATFGEIGAYLTTHFENAHVSQQSQEKILKVIEKARMGFSFAPLTDLDDFSGTTEVIEITEDWVLAQIWTRINSPDNRNSKQVMLDAFVDQLKDAGKTVVNIGAVAEQLARAFGLAPRANVRTEPTVVDTECIQGRISRYFQTFTHIDADPELAAPVKDDKEYENEAFTKSHKIIADSLKSNSAAAELYNSQEDELDIDQLKRLEDFKRTLRSKLEVELTKDYREILPEDHLSKIITQCQAGV